MTKRKTIEQFKKDLDDKKGIGEYDVLSKEYINNKTPIKVKHKCGFIYEVKPNHILYKNNCPQCSMNVRVSSLKKSKNIDPENYLRKITEGFEDEYEWLEEYKGNNKYKHKLLHKKCNKVIDFRPNDFQQGYRCTNCYSSSSRKTRLLNRFLDENNIQYQREVSFNGISGKRILKFDYLINDFIIEYDGMQHFKVNKNSIFEESYERCKVNDHIKNDKIKELNFNFIRIDFKNNMSDIKTIIKSILENDKEMILRKVIDNKLYYYDNEKEKIYNEKIYYTKMNKDYFK